MGACLAAGPPNESGGSLSTLFAAGGASEWLRASRLPANAAAATGGGTSDCGGGAVFVDADPDALDGGTAGGATFGTASPVPVPEPLRPMENNAAMGLPLLDRRCEEAARVATTEAL